MSYVGQRGPQTAPRSQKSQQQSQSSFAQCSSIPQYVCYQVSADGQSFRPVYLTAEAYESYLLGQQQEYQRRYEVFNQAPDYHEVQRETPADFQQHAYPMQPTPHQFQPYYEPPKTVPDDVTKADYRYSSQQEQVLTRRLTWNHDWNRVGETDYCQGSKSSLDSPSDSLNFSSKYHTSFPRYATASHPCSDTDEAHNSCAFHASDLGRSNTIFTSRGSQSLPPQDVGSDTVVIAGLNEWSTGSEPLRNHSHVNPNSLSLTPKDIERHGTFEGSVLDCQLGKLHRGRQRVGGPRKTSTINEDRCLQIDVARRQSLSEHSDGKTSDDDDTVLSEVDLGAEGVEFSPISVASVSIQDGEHNSTSPRPDCVKGEPDQSDSELEALPEDSDSDYSPVIETRPRRRITVSQHGPNAQPKRGRVPTKQKERLMLSSPECENVKAQQELCAGNVPILGRYSPAPIEYSEDTDASPSGRTRKRKRCRRPGEVFKAFVCDVKNCDKRFRRSEHLRRHIRSLHTGEKPFRCEVCLKTFSRSDNLAQHMKVHRTPGKRVFSATPTATTAAAVPVMTRRRRSSPAVL